MRGFDDCPLCLGSGAQCESCQNRRLSAADEHTLLWSEEIAGPVDNGHAIAPSDTDQNGSEGSPS